MSPSPDRPLTDRDYRALAQFRHALRVFLRFSEDAARDAGLTPAQHQLLLAVRGNPDGPPSLSEVADRLQLRRHSATELVQRASEAGLVSVVTDSDDRRRRRITVTPAGLEHLEQLSALHRRELRRFRTEMLDVLDELD
ncbi:MarR family winged helix-turn-helix transcriptional regulator [Actinospongicola halichondriae]|uniref:MarR family winged helix-turn-helix transcriptional regulator n=1 Tax=Actinospongicola halichondriae TaxID=3236844 RepID=UPI003D468C26